MKRIAIVFALSALFVAPASAGPAGWADPLAACGARCEAVLGLLHPADAGWLRILPPRAAETVRAVRDDASLFWDAEAGAALDRLEAAPLAFDAAALPTGERRCTVYWYGFLDDAARRVGTHRCRLERGDGGRLSIMKLTGEGLAGVVHPVESGAGIFIGRSFLPEQPERDYVPDAPLNAGNENFGNVVGIAVSEGPRLTILSADLLGFTEPDDTFFGLLVVE